MGRRPCGLVVDSGAALPPELEAAATVVPMRVELGGELFREGVDIDTFELQRRIAAGETARSSTPSPGAYLEAIRACDADAVVVLTMAESLSATHQAALLAARLLASEGDSRRVEVVDTGAASMGLGLVARVAAGLCRDRAGCDAVVARVRRAAAEQVMLGSLATLAPLARSGRLPALVAGIGDLLHIRPVFELGEGGGRRLALTRSRSAALAALEREALARAGGWEGTWLVVFHTGAVDDAARLRGRLVEALRVVRSETLVMPAVASVYTGPGMVGAALLPLHGAELAPPD